MDRLIFLAHFGYDVKKVELSFSKGGSNSIQIMMDDRYWGGLLKYKGQWEYRGNCIDTFTLDDIQIMGEMVEEWVEKMVR